MIKHYKKNMAREVKKIADPCRTLTLNLLFYRNGRDKRSTSSLSEDFENALLVFIEWLGTEKTAETVLYEWRTGRARRAFSLSRIQINHVVQSMCPRNVKAKAIHAKSALS